MIAGISRSQASRDVVLPETLGMDIFLALRTAGVSLRVAEGTLDPLVLMDNPVSNHIEATLSFHPPALPPLCGCVRIALQIHAGHVPA